MNPSFFDRGEIFCARFIEHGPEAIEVILTDRHENLVYSQWYRGRSRAEVERVVCWTVAAIRLCPSGYDLRVWNRREAFRSWAEGELKQLQDFLRCSPHGPLDLAGRATSDEPKEAA